MKFGFNLVSMNISKIKELTGHKGQIYSLISNNNSFFSGASDGFIVQWKTGNVNGNLIAKINSPVFCMAIGNNGNNLVIGTFAGNVYTIDLISKKILNTIHLSKKGIYSLLLIDEKNELIAGCGDGMLCVLELSSMRIKINLPLCEYKIREINQMDSKIVVCCGDGFLRFFDKEYYNCLDEIKLQVGGLNSMLKINDCIFTSGKDGKINVYDFFRSKSIKNIPAHHYSIYKIVQINEHFFASASRDKSIKIWNINDLEHPKKLDFKNFNGHTHSVNSLLFMAKKNILISCGDDKKLILWDVKTD